MNLFKIIPLISLSALTYVNTSVMAATPTQKAMQDAVQAGNQSKLTTLLNDQEEPISWTEPFILSTTCKHTLLGYASSLGNIQIVELLLSASRLPADQQVSDDSSSPLMLAAKAGHVNVVQLLLTRGSAINHRNSSQSSALNLAATAGKVEVVKILVDHHANVDNRTNFQSTPLIQATQRTLFGDNELKICELLLKNGADINAVDRNKTSAILYAAKAGNLSLVKWFLEHQANPKSVNSNGYSLVTFAIESGNSELLHHLIQLGVDIRALHPGRITSFILALTIGRMDMVAEVLQEAPELAEQANPAGIPPLAQAFLESKPEWIIFLLENKKFGQVLKEVISLNARFTRKGTRPFKIPESLFLKLKIDTLNSLWNSHIPVVATTITDADREVIFPQDKSHSVFSENQSKELATILDGYEESGFFYLFRKHAQNISSLEHAKIKF